MLKLLPQGFSHTVDAVVRVKQIFMFANSLFGVFSHSPGD